MSGSSIYSLPPPWPNQALALSKEASQVTTHEMVKQSAEQKTRSSSSVENAAPASTTEPVGSAGGSGVNVVA